MTLRKLSLSFHRWFGLLAAGWLFLVAISGSIIVFHEEIDRALNADWRIVSPLDKLLPVERLAQIAATAKPGNFPSFIDLPRRPQDSVLVYMTPLPNSRSPVAAGTHLFIDPYRGTILGERVLGTVALDHRHLAQCIYQFHMDFLLGPWMAWTFGLLGLFWLLSQMAGIVAALPKLKSWRASTTVRWRSRQQVVVYDIHRATGMWLLLVAMTLAATGVWFEWYQPIRTGLSRIATIMPYPTESAPTLPQPLVARTVSIDRAIALARLQTGGGVIDAISLLPDQGMYWLLAFDPRDAGDKGDRSILIDMTSGAVRLNQHKRDGSWADEYIAWQFPLHSGRAMGWPGRALVFLAGLAVSLLCATGIMMWWRRKGIGKRLFTHKRAQQA